MQKTSRSTALVHAIPLADRFWPRVRKTDTCWIWEGARSPQGYGEISTGARPARVLAAHRVAWELTNGPIPKGKQLLHSCDNPPCVNPAHLRPGSVWENMQDLIERGPGTATPRQFIPPTPYRKPLAERFWERVQKTETCWLWTGQKMKSGHGKIGRDEGKWGNILTHRLSWEIANGPVPDDLCVLHKCDVPNCVRPDHLFLGTRTDNMRDKTEKGRQQKGTLVPSHKLTEDEVREIRRRYDGRNLKNTRAKRGDPDTITNIAKDFGVSYITVYDAAMRKTWKHLT